MRKSKKFYINVKFFDPKYIHFQTLVFYLIIIEFNELSAFKSIFTFYFSLIYILLQGSLLFIPHLNYKFYLKKQQQQQQNRKKRSGEFFFINGSIHMTKMVAMLISAASWKSLRVELTLNSHLIDPSLQFRSQTIITYSRYSFRFRFKM